MPHDDEQPLLVDSEALASLLAAIETATAVRDGETTETGADRAS